MHAQLARTLPWLIALLAAAWLAGCGDEDDVTNPEGDNQEEVITTINLTFTPAGGGEAVTAQFRDADGPGGEEPTQSDIVLTSGESYTLAVELLNETVSADDEEYNIGGEIAEEAEEHQLFFTGTAVGAVVTHAYADKESDYGADSDGEDLPVGLSNTITATAAGDGTFIVTLKHQPPVNDTAVKTATSGIADGETDVEVEFALTVQ